MRVGLTFVGAEIGKAMAVCGPNTGLCDLDGMATGAIAGLAIAAMVDYCVAFSPAAARPEDAPSRQDTPRASRASIAAAGVAPTHGGASLVLGGRF